MTSFEVIIIGGLGGPSESSTQCFMVRPFDSNSVKSLCVDGGSGVGHIMDTIAVSNEELNVDDDEVNDDFHNYFKTLDWFRHDENNNYKYASSKRIKLMHNTSKQAQNNNPNIKVGFSNKLIEILNDKPTILQKAYSLYQGIESYYITHPHLDHINGMILNSPLMFERDLPSHKTLYGLEFTTNALQKHVFNDIIWPNLSNQDSSNLHIETLKESQVHKLRAFPNWEIIPFKLCHGTKVIDGSRVFSTVYVLRDKINKNAVIFFGDTDYNQHIDEKDTGYDLLNSFWEYLVNNIPLNEIRGIFIECSSACNYRDEQLYGHLSPQHLIDNLKDLHDKYNKKSKSEFDLNVIITHVKMVPTNTDPRITIIKELRTIAETIPELNGIKFYLALNKHRFIL